MAAAELNEHVRLALAKAGRKLAAARRNLAAGDFEETCSCAYYAAYHAIDAALRVEGHEVQSHDGLKMMFGVVFVQTGLVAPEMGRALRVLKDERENGDYALFAALTEEDAVRAVADAEALVSAMRSHMRLRGVAPEE